MKFIKLSKIEGKEVAVNIQHITSIEVCDEESTWVELVNGSKFLVRELADDILDDIKAVLI